MKEPTVHHTAAKIVALENLLSQFDVIRQYDGDGELEASRIANGVYDIISSAEAIKHILKTENPSDQDKMIDMLMEVGEHLRHIDYHLRDMRFFKTIIEINRY